VRNTAETLAAPRIRWHQQRHLAGIDTRLRLEALAADLRDRGSLAVRDSHPGFFGDRWTIWLDNNVLLRLKLFSSVNDHLAAVTHVGWNNGIGWMFTGRTTAGSVVTLAAWSVGSIEGIATLR
jgi:hypothetical protein